MSNDNGMAEDAVATMREAMAKALGGNCTFVDDDGFLLAALARRAIDAGLAEDLNPDIVRNMKRRDELQAENERLRAEKAELVEALAFLCDRGRDLQQQINGRPGFTEETFRECDGHFVPALARAEAAIARAQSEPHDSEGEAG